MANSSNTQKFTIFDIQQIHARVMSGIFFLFVWWFFGSRYGDFIYLVQDNDLFLYRWDFFTQTFSTPGDFLYYLTSFMIQFFYYPLLGGLILAVFLTLIQRLTARIFQLHGSFYFCSFLPSLLLCITPTWWCYYAFIPFCIPNMFSSIIGLLITFSVLFIYSSFKTPTARLTFIVIFSIFGYLPFGFWGLFPMLLCLFRERMITRRLWSERETSSQKDTSSTKKNAITSGVPASEQKALRVRCELMFSMILLIPLLWYYTVSFRFIKYHNIYIQGLIEEIRYLKDTLTCTITYSLLVVTCLFYVVGFGVVSWRTGRKTPTNRSKVTSKSKSEPLKERKAEKLSFKNRRPFINWLLFVFLLVTTVLTSCRGENFFAILKITRPLAEHDWQKILDIESGVAKPSIPIIGVRNVALFRTGQLGEKAFERPVGSGVLVDPMYIPLAASRSHVRSLVFEIGMTNIAYRQCMDDFVACDDKSASISRLLALAAITNEEYALAGRYLYCLNGTLFHRHWVQVCLAYLDSINAGISNIGMPRTEKISPEELAGFTKEINEVRQLKPSWNYAMGIYPTFAYLMFVSLENCDTAPLNIRELILTSYLMQKQLSEFSKYIDGYIKELGDKPVPRYFQEAVLLTLFQNKQKPENSGYKFSPEILNRFNSFTSFIEQNNLSDPEVQKKLNEQFADTYWRYFYDTTVFTVSGL